MLEIFYIIRILMYFTREIYKIFGAYLCYFGGMGKLPAQTTAILSYIDPVLAVLLSALVLHEHIGVFGIVGAVLVLGAALVSELPEKRAKENTYESDL